jgi:uncharacterized protein (DUF305 family)
MIPKTFARRTLRAVLAGAACTLALSLAACGGAGGGTSANSGGQGGPGAPAGASFNDADVMFAQMMIADHTMVGDMAKLATTRAANPRLKALARKMAASEGKTVKDLSGMLKGWGKPAKAEHPMEMPGMMTGKDMAKLKAMAGAGFDRMFTTMMITHHNGSIKMAREEQTNGASAKAKAMAGEMVKTQTAQVAQLKKISRR